MKILITAAFLLISTTTTLNANPQLSTHSSFATDDNSLAEFLKGIIEKEGITSYGVTFENYRILRRKKYLHYIECSFPGNNILTLKNASGVIIGYNLAHLVRYQVITKKIRNKSIKRLELLF